MSPGCNFSIWKFFPSLSFEKIVLLLLEAFFRLALLTLDCYGGSGNSRARVEQSRQTSHCCWGQVCNALHRPLKTLIFVLEGGTNQIDSTVGQWKGKIRIILIILIKQLMRKKNSTCNCFINLWVVTLQTISIRKRDKDRERGTKTERKKETENNRKIWSPPVRGGKKTLACLSSMLLNLSTLWYRHCVAALIYLSALP